MTLRKSLSLWTLVSSVKWEVNKISGLKLGSKEVSRGLSLHARPPSPARLLSALPGTQEVGAAVARP